MSGLRRVTDNEVKDAQRTVELFKERVAEGDGSPVSTVADTAPKDNAPKAKKSAPRNSKYAGQLFIHLDELEPDQYSIDLLQFKEFIDNLGWNGVTYEKLFENIEAYNQDTGKTDITVSKIKSKLYQMNSLNTISLTTIRDISKMLGYEMSFKFEPIISDEIFNKTTSVDDL